MINFSPTVKNALGAVRQTALNGGSIQLYSGTKPATPGDALTSQVLMVTLSLAHPSGTIANGVLTLAYTGSVSGDGSIQYLAVGTGTIAWARWNASDASWVADSDVGGMGSTAAIQLDALDVFTGGRILVVSSTLSEV